MGVNASGDQVVVIKSGSSGTFENLTVTGDLDFGDAITDTLTVTGVIDCNPGTFTGDPAALDIVGVFNTTVAAAGFKRIVNVEVTSGNTQNQYAFNMDMKAGGTGNLVYSAGRFVNSTAGAGTNYIGGGQANYALFTSSGGNTSGSNVGVYGSGSLGLKNLGILGRATANKASATNIGVGGFALNASGSSVQIGGYFGLESSEPTYTSSALMCDNGSQTSDIFVARDNGSIIYQISDGGLMNFQGGLQMKRTTVSDADYTALVGDYIIGFTSLTTGRTLNLPAAATAGAGKIYVIKDEHGSAGTNNITIDPDGAELIDGASTKPINANYNGYTIYCTGTAWMSY